MLLNELFYATIPEARRNPAQNEKQEGHEGAVKFLNSKGKDMRNYGVSMTEIPKLGINPGSRYNTPVGIYFYPADYYVSVIGSTKSNGQPGQLPFQHDAKYIQVFEFKGNIDEIDSMNQSVLAEYLRKLYDNTDTISKLINKTPEEVTKLLSRCVLESRTEAKSTVPGGILWYVLWALSFYAGRDKRDNAPPRSAVVWNTLLRLIGIDGLIDEGGGIIHENEPHQGVVLDPRSVNHVNTFKNIANKSDEKINMLETLAKLDTGSIYAEQVANAVVIYDLHYLEDSKSRQNCKKIMGKVMKCLDANPDKYLKIGRHNLLAMLKLTTNTNIRRKFIVDYNKLIFYKAQPNLNAMLQHWITATSGPEYDKVPEAMKRRMFEKFIPKYRLDTIMEIANDLKPYKSDPEVAGILKYFNNLLSRVYDKEITL